MAAPRPFAALTGALLARKGEAKPAMRPLLPADLVAAARADDAGLVPAPAPAPADIRPPAVLQEREALAAAFADDGDSGGRRIAFTLRLDAARHRRLREAAAAEGRSAQKWLTGALDAMLDGPGASDGGDRA